MFNIKVPSKINLCLKVTGKRPDGFHELFSIMCLTEIADTIKIKENKSVFPSLYITGKYGHMFDNFHTASIESNTVMIALDFMHQHYRTPINFDISVSKEIPIGGGMGGSSADAGAVINFMCQYFGIEMSREIKEQIGPSVGADVLFFTQGETALCEGIGDKITPIKINPQSGPIPIIVVYPDFQLSPSQIYGRLKLSNQINAEEIQEWRDFILDKDIDFKHLVEQTAKLDNDLTIPASEVRPEIGMIVGALKECRGSFRSGMTGSGSSCFAAFESVEDMQEALVEVSGKFPAYEVIASRLLPRLELPQIAMSSRPAMEMIFHPSEGDDEWEKIR